MSEYENYLRSLFSQKGIALPDAQEPLFREFASNPQIINNISSIKLLQELMTHNWQLKSRHEDIRLMQFAIPNANAGKPYTAEFDLLKLGLPDVIWFNLSGFGDSGLAFNSDTKLIEGLPQKSGNLEIAFDYKLDLDAEDAQASTK
ncbi:MAG: hypothetical protein EOO68_36925, partial [Moraxellaceae bacterium]